MRVRAIQTGFFNALRQPGDEFDVPDGTKGTWFERVNAEPKAKQKAAKAPAADNSEQDGAGEGLV